MFDFTRRVKLAAGDSIRRAAFKAVAGIVAMAASGFLIAAIWSWLANEMDLGSTWASLIIAVAMFAIAGILIAVSSGSKHQMPSGDDLSREIQARVSTAKDAAVGRVRDEASRVLGSAEARVIGGLRDAAGSIGLTEERVSTIKHQVSDGRDTLRKASDSNVGSMAKLFGAFAVGITLAAKIQETRHREPDYDTDDFI